MTSVEEKEGFPPLDLPNSILIAGVNTRPILRSAEELGMETIVVDCFDDIYVSSHADSLFVPEEASSGDYGHEVLFELVFEALSEHDPDVAVLTSGLEHYPGRIKAISERVKIAGNSHSQFERCSDTLGLFERADDLGIPHPDTGWAEKLGKAQDIAGEIGFPVVVKPPSGGGGMGIKLAENENDLKRSFQDLLPACKGDHLVVQEYIEGVNASSSVLSTSNTSRCLSVNEQIIGDERLGVPRKFGYCGNIIPLTGKEEKISRIGQYSEEICESLNLVGSNGVDFVLGDEPYLIEVNPRFQGTMDILERSLGINLLREHLRSLEGKIIDDISMERCSAKLIVYAQEEFEAPDLSQFPDVVDVPKEGSRIEKGSPICSILKSGKRRESVLDDAYELAWEVQRICHMPSTSSRSIFPA